MRTILTPVFALFILAGCNSTNSNPSNDSVAMATNKEQVNSELIAANTSQAVNGPICRKEKIIGSNMRRTVCRSRAQIEAEQKEAEFEQRAFRRQVGGDINESLRQTLGGKS